MPQVHQKNEETTLNKTPNTPTNEESDPPHQPHSHSLPRRYHPPSRLSTRVAPARCPLGTSHPAASLSSKTAIVRTDKQTTDRTVRHKSTLKMKQNWPLQGPVTSPLKTVGANLEETPKAPAVESLIPIIPSPLVHLFLYGANFVLMVKLIFPIANGQSNL